MRINYQDDNTTDVFPFTESGIPESDRVAVLRLVANEPDGEELAKILGLVEERVEPKPAPVRMNVPKTWCEIHNMPRAPRGKYGNRTVCRACASDYNRLRYDRQKASENVDS